MWISNSPTQFTHSIYPFYITMMVSDDRMLATRMLGKFEWEIKLTFFFQLQLILNFVITK